MKIKVTVKVSTEAAHTLHQNGLPTNELRELFKIIEELGVLLEPMHPGTKDPFLTPFFMVEVPDIATAEQAIDCLRQSKAIEAAYLKPPDELP